MFMIATVSFARSFHNKLHESLHLQAIAEEQNREISRLHESKARFLLDAGHDLRQPLQAMSLALHGPNQHPGKENLRIIRNAVDGMSAYVDRLQRVARLDELTTVVEEPVPLGPLFERVRLTFVELASARGLSLQVVDTRIAIRSDLEILEDMLRNLVSNAVAHTKQGGVVFGVRRRQGDLHIEVYDTGPGIADQEKSRIFDDFVQLSNPERDPAKGLGLGLSIVRRSAELIGASVQVRSVVGSGTCVSMNLGRDFAVFEPATERGNDQTSADNVGDILLIEDNETLRGLLVATLTDAGHAVVSAEHGERAMSILDAGMQPDLIITDGRLGQGWELDDLRKKLQTRHGPTPPVLVLTGDLRETDAANDGYHFVMKPVQPAKLLRKIDELL